jgi:hypothetical protein
VEKLRDFLGSQGVNLDTARVLISKFLYTTLHFTQI